MNNFLDRYKLAKAEKASDFNINKNSFTINMKTFNQFELFKLLTPVEGQVFGLLLHQLYENNRSNIIDTRFKEYLFTEMGWDIKSKGDKDRFTRILVSLDAKDVITRTEDTKYIVNPFVQLVGGVDSFVTATTRYYITRANNEYAKASKTSGRISEIFHDIYEKELEAIVKSLNSED